MSCRTVPISAACVRVLSLFSFVDWPSPRARPMKNRPPNYLRSKSRRKNPRGPSGARRKFTRVRLGNIRKLNIVTPGKQPKQFHLAATIDFAAAAIGIPTTYKVSTLDDVRDPWSNGRSRVVTYSSFLGKGWRV